MINSYKELKVWQNSVDLAVECYKLTAAFPQQEMFGLTSQIRRSVVSIAANIAEGHGRESTGSFVQSLRIAQGSLKEVETHMLIAARVGLMHEADYSRLETACEELGKMIRGLIRSLQRKQ